MTLIKILIEECSEVIKVCCKISRFGFLDYNPDDPKKSTNIDKLEKEAGDILAMIDILVNNEILTKSGLENAKQSKFIKLAKYYDRELTL